MSPPDGAREISCLRGLYDILTPPCPSRLLQGLAGQASCSEPKALLNAHDNSYLRLPSISDVSGMLIPPALRHS